MRFLPVEVVLVQFGTVCKDKKRMRVKMFFKIKYFRCEFYKLETKSDLAENSASVAGGAPITTTFETN